MTNTDFYNLIQSYITDNTSGDITPVRLRTLLDDVSNHIGGNVYYRNSSAVEISLPAATETQMTNDGASEFTVTAYKPHYVNTATLWSNNELKLDDIANGANVNIRLESQITTSANVAVEIYAIFYDSLGAEVFRILVDDLYYKGSGTHDKTTTYAFFMDANIANGTMEVKIKPDSTSTGLLKSVYIDVQ